MQVLSRTRRITARKVESLHPGSGLIVASFPSDIRAIPGSALCRWDRLRDMDFVCSAFWIDWIANDSASDKDTSTVSEKRQPMTSDATHRLKSPPQVKTYGGFVLDWGESIEITQIVLQENTSKSLDAFVHQAGSPVTRICPYASDSGFIVQKVPPGVDDLPVVSLEEGPHERRNLPIYQRSIAASLAINESVLVMTAVRISLPLKCAQCRVIEPLEDKIDIA
jgi:hypothetical protein